MGLLLRQNQIASNPDHLDGAVDGENIVNGIEEGKAQPHHVGVMIPKQEIQRAVEDQKQQKQKVGAQSDALFRVNHQRKQDGDKDNPENGKPIVAANNRVVCTYRAEDRHICPF